MKSSHFSLTARGLALANRFFHRPERPRYFEIEPYQVWLEKNALDLYEHFYSKYASFSGKRILDLGCGYGGKITAYGKHNPELICGIDINTSLLTEAKRYSARATIHTAFIGADVHALPFQNSVFDLVISDDGFDHFKHPERVLDEIMRILKPNGIAFVSFVPYYSTDCSHMGEYLRVPWHHVFFSRNTIKQALELIANYEAQQRKSQKSSVDGVFDTFLHHLSRLSIRGFKRALINSEGFQLVRLRKQSKRWARLFTYFPIINELFSDVLYCVLKRQHHSRLKYFSFTRQALLDIKQDFKALIKRSALLCRILHI